MGDHHHKPDTTMMRLWWPQPARPPPQQWRQAAKHSEAPLGVAPPQPDTTWQDPEVSRCFMGCYAIIVADPPPTAHHGDGSGGKSRRYCGGRGSGVGGWQDKVEWLERVEKCGGDSPKKSAGKVFRRRLAGKMERVGVDFELVCVFCRKL
nr:hypothetical protein [Tanacetum cinerariifolium]